MRRPIFALAAMLGALAISTPASADCGNHGNAGGVVVQQVQGPCVQQFVAQPVVQSYAATPVQQVVATPYVQQVIAQPVRQQVVLQQQAAYGYGSPVVQQVATPAPVRQQVVRQKTVVKPSRRGLFRRR